MATEIDANSAVPDELQILDNRDYRGLPGTRSGMGSTHPSGPALVTAAADADPVTLLVLGWLAAKRSENTRTAYTRDIGITPQRRASSTPWLDWCQQHRIHPVTGITALHVARPDVDEHPARARLM
jgi:hypothetical protein